MAGSDGLCAAHRDPNRMREIGRKGGSVGKGNAALRRSMVERPSLREYLRETVAPSEVWQALRLALEGGSEPARVSASKVLLEALHDPHEKREPVVVEYDVTPEQAAATLAVLEEAGLLVAPKTVVELRAKVVRLEAQLAAIPAHVVAEYVA